MRLNEALALGGLNATLVESEIVREGVEFGEKMLDDEVTKVFDLILPDLQDLRHGSEDALGLHTQDVGFLGRLEAGQEYMFSGSFSRARTGPSSGLS